MDNVILGLLKNAQSEDVKSSNLALQDIRLIIERCTQNRYGEEEIQNYWLLFNDRNLLDYRITEEDLMQVKYFLIFALFNFPDRSVLVAKCIKVLFDISIRESICVGIETFFNRDDDTTCELLFAITDVGDFQNYLSNQRINALFKKVSIYGGSQSKEVAKREISYYEKWSMM